jgi:Domain of unknown function (DUF5615)
MASLYLDHDVSAVLAGLLAAAGHDVLTTRAVAHERSGDHEQLLFAAQEGRILVSHIWRDYRLLHAAWQLWSREWEQSTELGGILIVDQGASARLAEAIGVFVDRGESLENRLYRWHAGRWREYP